uniref:phosphoenolpyruvate mutase n=1 Tax=Paramoeba aestuarina TaxID=180227 RepID=A0A7S4JHC3_9EUKA
MMSLLLAPTTSLLTPNNKDIITPNNLTQQHFYTSKTLASKALRLRNLLTSPRLEFIMEAHNGLSAKIVEETGFDGVWASGLTMSASLGVRDNNEASWTQVLEVLEFMADRTHVPILVDGDTGYGNFNNARRLIRKLESRGIAGVCLEDKVFPKTNSFIDGENQPLADIHEFCGKIAACKDTQSDPNFNVVARIEALITGWGMDEALRRADAYRKAGADAILIHSKNSNADEILEFCRLWENQLPVVIVPTKYWNTPTEEFRKAGVSLIIWANHNLRSSIIAMKDTCSKIHENESLIPVEKAIAPVSEVFRLQDADELKDAEKTYLNQPILEETVRYFVKPQEFHELLSTKGTDFYAGVPDSLLANFCSYVQQELPKENHVITANEGSAIATAAGHYLATGKIPCVYLQNSGLGNAVNPLLSLVDKKLYQIPMLVMVGWRGQPGRRDEPQHLRMGEITPEFFKTMGIPYEILPDFPEGAEKTIENAYSYMNKEKAPYGLLIPRATFADYPPPPAEPSLSDIHREEAISIVTRHVENNAAFVSTTGFASRELFEIREQNEEGHGRDFLTIGSMGHASAIGLGLANGQPNRPVYCLDGDGSLIMHMGSLVTAGQSGLSNFKHVVLNNGVHDSVGGQPTGLGDVPVTAMAQSCGYKTTLSVDKLEDLAGAVRELANSEGPAMLEVKLALGTRSNLGRPTSSPATNKADFMEFMKKN